MIGVGTKCDSRTVWDWICFLIFSPFHNWQWEYQHLCYAPVKCNIFVRNQKLSKWARKAYIILTYSCWGWARNSLEKTSMILSPTHLGIFRLHHTKSCQSINWSEAAVLIVCINNFNFECARIPFLYDMLSQVCTYKVWKVSFGFPITNSTQYFLAILNPYLILFPNYWVLDIFECLSWPAVDHYHGVESFCWSLYTSKSTHHRQY